MANDSERKKNLIKTHSLDFDPLCVDYLIRIESDVTKNKNKKKKKIINEEKQDFKRGSAATIISKATGVLVQWQFNNKKRQQE